MKYKCLNCNWTGHWDSLIHESMCPVCRSNALPLPQKGDPLHEMITSMLSRIPSSQAKEAAFSESP